MRPFKVQAEREKLQKLLDSIWAVKGQIEEIRDIIQAAKESKDGIDNPADDCTCVSEGMDAMDGELYAFIKTLHVYVNSALYHLREADAHDAKQVVERVVDTVLKIGPGGIEVPKEEIH